jgi:hypothetical protein
MSTKLLSPEPVLDLQEEEQDENNNQIMKSMEQEIECPRCSDIMTLTQTLIDCFTFVKNAICR